MLEILTPPETQEEYIKNKLATKEDLIILEKHLKIFLKMGWSEMVYDIIMALIIIGISLTSVIYSLISSHFSHIGLVFSLVPIILLVIYRFSKKSRKC